MSKENWILLLGGASNVQGETCIREAHNVGLKVLVADTLSNLDKFNYTELADRIYPVNEFTIDILDKLRSELPNINRVYSFREKLQFIASQMNCIIGCHWTAASVINTIQDKYRCRNLLRLCGINQPWNIICNSKKDIMSKLVEINEDKFILKPVGQAGSKGVFLYQDGEIEEILAKIDDNDFPYLIEQFVEGDEYSIEMLICENNYHLLAITKKYIFEGTFIEQGHALPANNIFGKNKTEEIFNLVKASCQYLGITHGMIHAEFWYKNGEVTLGEIHNRPGGDLISIMAAKVSGVNIYASQFANTLIRQDSSYNYMAVWSCSHDEQYIAIDEAHEFYYSNLNNRNMFCTYGCSFDEALKNAKVIAGKFSI